MAEKKTRKRTMTDEHKAALAAGRNEGRAVRRYLEALELTSQSVAASGRRNRSRSA